MKKTAKKTVAKKTTKKVVSKAKATKATSKKDVWLKLKMQGHLLQHVYIL